jgi:hypothetical protein
MNSAIKKYQKIRNIITRLTFAVQTLTMSKMLEVSLPSNVPQLNQPQNLSIGKRNVGVQTYIDKESQELLPRNKKNG